VTEGRKKEKRRGGREVEAKKNEARGARMRRRVKKIEEEQDNMSTPEKQQGA